MKGKSPVHCPTRKIEIQKEKLQAIDEQHYILILPDDTEVTEICDTSEVTVLKGTFLLTLKPNCKVVTPFNEVSTSQITEGTAITLPGIQVVPKPETQRLMPLQLEDIPLDKIHEIHMISKLESHQFNHLHAISYATIIPIFLILITLLTIYGYLKYKPSNRQRKQKEEIELANSSFHPNSPSGIGGII